MSFDFLQEAFKKLDCLSEDTFSMSNDGIKGLTELDTEDKMDAEADVTEIIDVDADTENDIKDSYTGKVVMECPVCHSFVFAEKDEIELDKKTELANPTQECPYCCELGGFNIIGQIAEYNVDEEDVEESEEVDETEDETAIPEEEVEEESVDDEENTSVNEALSPEDEEFRKGSLLVSKYQAMLSRVVPKTKLGAWLKTLSNKIDAKHNAKKEGTLTLWAVVGCKNDDYTAEEIEENKKIVADFKRELKKLDLLCLEDTWHDDEGDVVSFSIFRKNANVSDVKGDNGSSPISTQELKEALSPEDEEFAKGCTLIEKYLNKKSGAESKTKFGRWLQNLDAKHSGKVLAKEMEARGITFTKDINFDIYKENVPEVTDEEIQALVQEQQKLCVDFKNELKKLDLLYIEYEEDKLKTEGYKTVVIIIFKTNVSEDTLSKFSFTGKKPISTKELKEALDCHGEDCDCPECEFESCVKKAIKEQFSDDAWTSFEYDDELDTPVVEVFNGEQKLGEYYLVNEKLVSALSESLTVDSDGDTISVGGANEIEVTTDDGLKVSIENTAGTDEESKTEESNEVESDAEISPADDGETATDDTDEVEDVNDDKADDANSDTEDTTDTEKGEEVISELSDEDKEEIKNGETEEQNEGYKDMKECSSSDKVDVKLEEIDEEAFNDLCESFLKKTYANVESFNICDAYTDDNSKIVLEGVINFKSGKSKNTCFKFESKDITKSGRARFIGENLQLSNAKKAFTISGNICDGKFITESLNYNYGVKDRDGKTSRVYGTVNRK